MFCCWLLLHTPSTESQWKIFHFQFYFISALWPFAKCLHHLTHCHWNNNTKMVIRTTIQPEHLKKRNRNKKYMYIYRNGRFKCLFKLWKCFSCINSILVIDVKLFLFLSFPLSILSCRTIFSVNVNGFFSVLNSVYRSFVLARSFLIHCTNYKWYCLRI